MHKPIFMMRNLLAPNFDYLQNTCPTHFSFASHILQQAIWTLRLTLRDTKKKKPHFLK